MDRRIHLNAALGGNLSYQFGRNYGSLSTPTVELRTSIQPQTVSKPVADIKPDGRSGQGLKPIALPVTIGIKEIKGDRLKLTISANGASGKSLTPITTITNPQSAQPPTLQAPGKAPGSSPSIPTVATTKPGSSPSIPTVATTKPGSSPSIPTIATTKPGSSPSIPTVATTKPGSSPSVPTVRKAIPLRPPPFTLGRAITEKEFLQAMEWEAYEREIRLAHTDMDQIRMQIKEFARDLNLVGAQVEEVQRSYVELILAKAALHGITDIKVPKPGEKAEVERTKLKNGQHLYDDLIGEELVCDELDKPERVSYEQMLKRVGLALEYLCNVVNLYLKSEAGQKRFREIYDHLPLTSYPAIENTKDDTMRFCYSWPFEAKRVYDLELATRPPHIFLITQEESTNFNPASGQLRFLKACIDSNYIGVSYNPDSVSNDSRFRSVNPFRNKPL